MTGTVKYGIQETVDVVKLVVAASNGVQASLENDSKITLSDLQNFTGLIFLIGPAFSGIGKIPHEIKDLDANELEELKSLILTSMPEIGDKWEDVVEHSLMAAWHIYGVVQALGKTPTA